MTSVEHRRRRGAGARGDRLQIQVYFHQGYEPADHDRHDMTQLRQTFGITTHF
ncbi:nucleotidyltransferase domain-containing protein [Streptomyces scabichelini]|uniref:nucleotidyltransferase domain-containing protein n=1 Tax=Streptomyces scabichelini TaxID=2711217 RepID=UPI003B973A98